MSALAARTEVATSVLEAVDVTKHFGGVEALRGVTLEVPAREIVGLIGPNGSGKTTLFNCISGVFPPTSGRILVDGKKVASGGGHRVARAGAVRTFRNIRLFGSLTALQNVEVGALERSVFAADVRAPTRFDVLERLGIAHLADRWAATLSYGDQRRLEVARALAGAPRFLLLDEPAAGMDPERHTRRRRRGALRLVYHDDRRVGPPPIGRPMTGDSPTTRGVANPTRGTAWAG